MRPRDLVLSIAALGTLAVPRTARAERCDEEALEGFSTCVDVDEVWARPGNTRFFMLPPTATTPEGQVAVSVHSTWIRRPFRLQASGPSLTPREVMVIDNLTDTTFNLALGVTDRLEVDLSAPVTFYQDGAGYYALTGSDAVLPRSVVRDPRFGVAVAVLREDRAEGAEGATLTGRFDFTAPLGDEDAFAGAPSVVFAPAIDGGFRWGPLTVQAEVAARIRGTEDLGAVRYGTQLVGALGANVLAYRPVGLSFSAEALAAPVLIDQEEGAARLVPGEWMASARVAPFLAGDVFLQAGAGTAIPFSESAVSAPQVRASLSFGYAPLGLDSDRDGVLDRDDACPKDPEDRDSFQDADGCPDPDNDGDRIPDVKDRCRDAAETVDGFKDDDGCPDDDDDGDGVPDVDDQCRNEPEDKDGFADDDGCPDPDNDGDGVLDGADQCRDQAEDPDGFKDEDGCPDPDNDGDGVLDGVDRCRGIAEDPDKFEDEDGCPDPDNDADGILDGVDACPNEAETLDGKDDRDGCPEAGATSLAKVDGRGKIVFVSAPRFARGKADVPPAMKAQLDVAASILAAQPKGAVLVVEVFSDAISTPGAADAALVSRRVATIRRAFKVPTDNLTVVSGDGAPGRTADSPQLEISVVRSSE